METNNNKEENENDNDKEDNSNNNNQSKKNKNRKRRKERKRRQKEREEVEEKENKEKIENEKKEKEEKKKNSENKENNKDGKENNSIKKEENKEIKMSQIKEENLLLYINPISKYLIKYLKSHDITEFTGLNTKNGLVGLENLGNTCYMNSALQCLSNCEYLTKYFLSGYYKRELNLTSKFSTQGKIAESYSNLLQKLYKETNSYINPSFFHYTFASYVKLFANSSQHDSHEMLIYLIEKLHEDLNRNKEKQYIELEEKKENEDDINASNRWWETHQKRDNSIIMDLFSGQYKSTLRCPYCDRVSITYDQFSCLELPIDNKCYFGTSYIINNKNNTIRKINLIFGEDETFKDIREKINCQKEYKAIFCRYSRMYLACLKDNHNIYELIDSSYKNKNVKSNKIIFYEYEKNELDNKLIYYVIPVVENNTDDILFFPKVFYYNKNDTIENFYLDIKKYYHKYYNEKNENFSDEKIKLRIVNNLTLCSSSHPPCDYCHSKECESCEFKFNKNMTMGDLMETQSKKRSFVMYLEIPKENSKIKLYDEYNDEEDFKLNTELTLENCINSFSRCEKLDESNEWYCSKCKEHRKGYKQLEFFRLPRYLLLQLKRFKGQSNFFFYNAKNSTNVIFPLNNLNLNKYLVGPKNMDYIYDLIAVSQHYGASFGGHYTAVCKKGNNWYEFDDENVEKISESKIVNSHAYILVYKLRE